MYDITCFDPHSPSLSRQDWLSKPDHPSNCNHNVSDRDVDYDVTAELALNHPGTEKRIFGGTSLSQQRAWKSPRRHSSSPVERLLRGILGNSESAGDLQLGHGLFFKQAIPLVASTPDFLFLSHSCTVTLSLTLTLILALHCKALVNIPWPHYW